MAEKEESTLDTIIHLRGLDPFRVFHVVTSSGDRYTIDNPLGLAIGSSQLHFYPRTGMGIHLRINQISAVEVTSEEPLV